MKRGIQIENKHHGIRLLLAVCMLTGLFTGRGRAEEALFSASRGADRVTVPAAIRYAGETPYVALDDLLRGLGGAVQVTAEGVQARLSEATAALTINADFVTASQASFALNHPVRMQDEQVYIALEDVPSFFEKAYSVPMMPLEKDRAIPQLTPVEPEEPDLFPEEEEPGLLENLETERPINETAAPESVAQQEAPPPAPEIPDPQETPPPAPEIPNQQEAPSSTGQPDMPLPGDTAAFEGEGEGVSETADVSQAAGTVIIDPGHGGEDAGIVASETVSEKNLTLDIALRIRRILSETTRIAVSLTRETDRSMSFAERVSAHSGAADFVLSMHAACSSDARTEGVTLFTDAAVVPANTALSGAARESAALRSRHAEKAASLAYHIAQSLSRHEFLGSITYRTAPLLIQREMSLPCIVMEFAYLSNPPTALALEDEAYCEQIAEATAQAIASALSTKNTQ